MVRASILGVGSQVVGAGEGLMARAPMCRCECARHFADSGRSTRSGLRYGGNLLELAESPGARTVRVADVPGRIG